jgi:hypothetical protein
MTDDWSKLFSDTFDIKESETELFWTSMFELRPECLYDLIYDLVAFQKGQLGRGRRKAMDANLDDIFKAVYGTL